LGAAYGVAIAESPRVVADKILPQSRRRELSLRNRRTSYTT
jgi:hypothetical protein